MNRSENGTNFDSVLCAKLDDIHIKTIENVPRMTSHMTVGCVVSVNSKSNFRTMRHYNLFFYGLKNFLKSIFQN